jgi:hypothetical protein
MTDQRIAQSSEVVGKAEVLVPSADFTRRPINFQIVQTPPRNLVQKIAWIQGKHQTVTTISTTAPTEANHSFQLADLVTLSGLSAYFDQYCIYSVTVNITPSYEGAGSTLYTFGTVFTAIDYDSVATGLSSDQIQAFSTCVTFEMSPGQGIQRYIKPCVAPALYATYGTILGYAIGRMWVDSANTSVPHYGFRSLFISNSVVGLSVTFDFNYVIGLRNNF